MYRFSWVDKKQKKTTNPISKYDDKWFQYVAGVTLNHKETGRGNKLLLTDR